MNKYLGLILIIFLVSCKSKAIVAEGNASSILTSDKIIDNHYNNKKDFSTLYIKSSAHYEDEKQSQNVTAEIKIKKDEVILVSIRFLGITMAKALITPSEVKYYEKLGGKYFEGDYVTLSQWLGTDLDYQKVQNMLVGEALDDLKKGKFTNSIVDKLYKIENNSDANTSKSYLFEAEKFLIKAQQVNQKEQERAMIINYPNYAAYGEIDLPTSITINAVQKEKQTTINIEYKSVTINDELTFPYSVPEGYERITIH
jgi:Domain of unknown function (DUF4292)